MEKLIVFASSECMGWPDVQELVSSLRQDPEVKVSIRIKDPLANQEEFRERGLIICPSFVIEEELVAVGVPELKALKKRLLS